MSKGAPLKGITHTHLSFHSAGFIRGDLPSKPIESHARYTQRRGAYAIETSRMSVRCKVLFTGGICRLRGRF